MKMGIGLGAGVIKQPEHLDDKLLRSPASFITVGSFTLLHREGNKDPTYYFDEETQTSYNAIGLKNPGAIAVCETLSKMGSLVHTAEKRFRVSLAPTEPGSLRKMLTTLSVMPLRTLVDEWEFNAACPNHRDGEHLHDVLACDPRALREMLQETSGFAAPVSRQQKALKIAPDTPKKELTQILELCDEFAIGTIVSGNTRRVPTPALPGKPPLISVDYCGQAGKSLFEGARRQMEELANLRERHNITIKLTFCGGILTGSDLYRASEVGADEAQLVTGFLQYGARIFQDIFVEL